MRQLLQLVLADEGHHVMTAEDAAQALKLLWSEAPRPAVVVVDYNLPGGVNGLELAAKLRQSLGLQAAVLIPPGDISTETLRDIALENCIPLHKPAKPEIPNRVIQGLLPAGRSATMARPALYPGIVFVVDDDNSVRATIRLVLEDQGLVVQTFADCESFLAAERPGGQGRLLIDAYLHGGMDGLDLLCWLREAEDPLPAIMMTIARAEAARQIEGLTERQMGVLDRVLAGDASKNIATDLGISPRTVNNHRAIITQKTGARSLPALARLALTAARGSVSDPPIRPV